MKIYEVTQHFLAEETRRPYAVINVGANHPSNKDNAANIIQIAKMAHSKGYIPVIIPPNGNYNPAKSSTRYNFRAAHQASLDAIQALRGEGIDVRTEQGRFGTKGHQGMVHFTGEFSKELAKKYGGPNTLFIGASNINGVANNSTRMGLGGTKVATSGLGTSAVLQNVTKHFERNPQQIASIPAPATQSTPQQTQTPTTTPATRSPAQTPTTPQKIQTPIIPPYLMQPVSKNRPSEIDRQLGIVKPEPFSDVKLSQFDKDISISSEPSAADWITQTPPKVTGAASPKGYSPRTHELTMGGEIKQRDPSDVPVSTDTHSLTMGGKLKLRPSKAKIG